MTPFRAWARPYFLSWTAIAVAGSAGVLACWGSKSGSGSDNACPPVMVDRFKELEIVDDGVVSDGRARNASGGPWSFRHLVETMTPPGVDSSAFVLSWLNEWAAATTFNGFPLDEPDDGRGPGMKRVILCPWMLATPSNSCDIGCSQCAHQQLDLAKAPFRLIGIVNRIDIRTTPLTSGPAGEGRFVFALTAGPADDPASPPQPMTLAMEYTLPATHSPAEWASAWHRLGTFPDFGEDFRVALQALTDEFTARGIEAARTNGSALAQVRTNESALDWIWQLREFKLGPDGNLHHSGVQNTPAKAMNGTPTLGNFILANRQSIESQVAVVPQSLVGGSAFNVQSIWSVPGVDEPTRKAFAQQTCNGCHGIENPTIDTAFHLSPFHSGNARISTFLSNPAAPTTDELTRRTNVFQSTLCGQ